MTDEEMNLTIAKLCGWICDDHGYWSNDLFPDGSIKSYPLKGAIPPYVKDLNAMHQAEKVLNVNQLSQYADALDKICVPVHICPLTHWSAVAMSTARQRAEALIAAFAK